MPTITVGFDPATDDYDNVIALVDAAFNAETVEDDTDDGPLPDGWTPRRMKSYINLLSPDGRKVLRYLAENLEVEVSDVQVAVGIYDARYAGMMSTFGHAKRLAPGVNTLPFTKHGTTYYIKDKIAALALDTLDEIGA